MLNKSSLKVLRASSLLVLGVIVAFCCVTPVLTAAGDVDSNVAAHLVDDDKVECPNATFDTIQSAVDAAAAGDTIEVCPGTYQEQVEVTKPLSIKGVSRHGAKSAVVRPLHMAANTDFLGDPIAAAIVVRDTSGVAIRNITVDGVNNGLACDPASPFLVGILYQDASGVIELAVVKNMLTGCALGDGIDVLSTEQGTSRVTVRDSSIHDNDFAGIFAFNPGTYLQAIRNVITGLGPTDLPQFGIQLNGATGVIEQNIVTNHVFAPCSVSPAACEFVSHGIGVFEADDARIVSNIVGKSNTGIFVGNFAVASNGVRVLENRVFDTDVANGHGIFVGVGENNIVTNNIITNSDRAGVLVVGANNTIRDNTINDAAIGLLAGPGNAFVGNRFFNVAALQQVFEPAKSFTSSQRALEPGAAVRPLLRKKFAR